ncbi:MAG: alpha/beta fold hydrolase [Pseudomonadota bacterium]
MRLRNTISLLSAAILCTACATKPGNGKPEPLVIQSQGSFSVGGKTITDPDGKTFHGDHAYVFYQVPAGARKLPVVLWHGAGQSSRTWETTPDGREGYQNILLRNGYSTYVLDQPRRGKAGRSTLPMALTPARDEQASFNIFRLGIWPNLFPGVQFPREPAALDQYFGQMTPNTGPFDLEVNADAVAALFQKIGPGVLVTHSQGGGPGWFAAARSTNVRAIVAYEPGSNFIFPQGEVPAPMPSSGDTLEAVGVPLAQFMQLTKIPITIVYGDNIPAQPMANPGQDQWRTRLAMARLWAEAVNRRGGKVTVVHLPELGIRGNTHFPFSDLNNLDVADLMFGFLKTNGLD